ncbi:hypothetical protein [Undibacter mobilis]|uniref:hypothetical protein n=1 Tax=Undibacter mobilis TaxID=2292256 RepID=UPI0011C05B4C|nr:hypothetical protein [Undibacter mobilis]
MINIDLPPLCPVCGGKTRLREMHRTPRGDGYSCFFRCVDCRTDYPRKLTADDAKSAGFLSAPSTGDGNRDPAAQG